MAGYLFGGNTGETAASLKQKRAVSEALLASATDSLPKNEWEGMAAIARALSGRIGLRNVEKKERAAAEGAKGDWASISAALSPGAFPAAPKDMPSDYASDRVAQAHGGGDLSAGIVQTAQALGIDPLDLGTAISYETAGTFDPTKKGPTTQWGQHQGLIQFGEPQAKQYGVDWNDPLGSQLGPDGAIAKYLRDTGVKPGMGMMDIYSAINAGGVGRYNASDANNGGAPGTVADKVNQQMVAHRQKAAQLLGGQGAPQMAQAGGMPEMAGNAPSIPQGGPSVQMLMQALQNPGMNEQQQSIISALLNNQLAGQEPPEPFTLGEGQVRYDGQGNVIAKGGDKAAAKPSAVQVYEYAKEQGFPGTLQDWEASKKGGMSLQVDPATGAVTFQQGSNIKPLTEGQSKDVVYSTRAAGALPILDQFGGALTSLPESIGGAVPGVGNFMKSEGYQKAEQAGNEFLQAILRKDTGAAITSDEMAEYGTTYLPRPGDKPEVLAQKKASRARALAAIEGGMSPQAILAQERALAKGGAAPAAPSPQGVPEGVAPEEWEVMTPEERRLFQ